MCSEGEGRGRGEEGKEGGGGGREGEEGQVARSWVGRRGRRGRDGEAEGHIKVKGREDTMEYKEVIKDKNI